MKYNFHPAALTEYSEAVKFYAENNIELAQNLINAVEDAIFRIIESPQRYPVTDQDIHRCLVRKFPYVILYSIEDEYILIIAVMHCSRKPVIDSPLVLGLDNIDEIFPYPEITQQFSALLRAWHENAKTEEIWQKLRLVIAHSQDVYVSINVNQSPFNVGLSVEIGEFNNTQIKELVQRYGLIWSDTEINELKSMINGHPYLLTTALKKITQDNLTLSQFLKIAPTNQSPYSGFLKSYLLELEKDVLLKRAMQQVINSNIPIPIDSTQAFKLRSLGLIEFKGNEVQCLCNLYRLYFSSRL